MKVSIVTACYNSEYTIGDTVQSVLEQGYGDIEYLIIDGESKDRTLDIIKSYKVQHVLSERDDGIYDAFNKGVRLCSGEIIGFLNSDDYYVDSTVIEKVVQSFERHPELDMVIGNVVYICDKTRRPLRYYNSNIFRPWMIRLGFAPAHPAAFFRRRVFKEFDVFDESFEIAGDFEFFVRIFKRKSINFLAMGEDFVMMRVGGVSTRGLKSYIISTREILRALTVNNVYSNYLIILARFPLKYLSSVYSSCSRLLKRRCY